MSSARRRGDQYQMSSRPSERSEREPGSNSRSARRDGSRLSRAASPLRSAVARSAGMTTRSALPPMTAAASVPRGEVAEQYVHGLYFCVAQQLVDAFLAAEAGVLVAAERRSVEM